MTTSGAAPGGHSSPLSLMSCVRESSPQDLLPPSPPDNKNTEQNEPSKKRRFHPFRGLRKMFRRKLRHSGSEETVPESGGQESQDSGTPGSKDSHRSRSTSELLAGEETTRRKSGGGIYPGLSVSHDSVFTADARSTSSDLDLDTAQSSSSLSIQQLMHNPNVRAELLDVVRRRRGRGDRGDTSDDEEDLGLPRSPCNSPTQHDKSHKDHPTKSQSTCSDGSLLSMGSSEMDEDSFGGQSRHSSAVSLHGGGRLGGGALDGELELGGAALGAPLSHSAARHKMAVKPKRTHGAPRRRRNPQVTSVSALPTTLEVNEELPTRSITPETNKTRETVAELYSATSMNKIWNATTTSTEHHLKSSSLPPGLALPTGPKLSRSRSNAGTKRAESFPEEDDDQKDEKDKKKEESFFGRFLARRSGKKQTKKAKSEDHDKNNFKADQRSVSLDVIEQKEIFSYKERVDDKLKKKIDDVEPEKQLKKIKIEESKDINITLDNQMLKKIEESKHIKTEENLKIIDLEKPKKMKSDDYILIKTSDSLSLYKNDERKSSVDSGKVRTGPASRQRIQPIDIPASPEEFRKHEPELNSLTECILDTSPKNSPPKLFQRQIHIDEKDVPKWFDDKSKIKIAGLSSYQQKVLSYDEYDNSFKSLNYEENVTKVVTKSYSFHVKSDVEEKTDSSIEPDSLNKEPLSFTSHSDSIDGEKEKSNVTISCVNSQILSSVNTQSSNQVIVSISKPDEFTLKNEKSEVTKSDISPKEEIEGNISPVLITRVQLKRDKTPNPAVPEFLKIQLNKVEKPTNVVLSTEPEEKAKSKTETDKENGEILQRKFSNDIEIVDKDTSEALVEVPVIKKFDDTKVKNFEPKKSPPLNVKPFLKKKSNSVELSEATVKTIIQNSASTEQLNKIETITSKIENVKLEKIDLEPTENVLLRRKSTQKKDKDSEEPELMKVFARRSLKLKDSEAETLSQQVMVLVENSQIEAENNTANRSRDSDKENEFSESPQEERKKISFPPKETKPLNESKILETEVTIRTKPINNKIAAFNNPRFQKSASLTTPTFEKNETRNNKSFIETKEKPKIFEKNINRTRIMAFKEKDIEIKKSENKKDEVITNLKSEFENEEYVPMFKRISQRKEEWEQRAQQAMKKTVP